jgi:hypothetical protein
LLTLPATIKLRGAVTGEDEHGNPTYAASTEFHTKCYIGQQSRSEPGEDGALQREGFRLFLLPDAPLKGWDTIEADGHTWEITGPPWHVWNPRTASFHHVEAQITRTE